jgi:hypothetical protein
VKIAAFATKPITLVVKAATGTTHYAIVFKRILRLAAGASLIILRVRSMIAAPVTAVLTIKYVFRPIAAARVLVIAIPPKLMTALPGSDMRGMTTCASVYA